MPRNENYEPKTETAKSLKKTICINFFAGAGAGKSTMSTSVHGLLKMHNINSEYTAEHAKDLAWEGRLALRRNDVHIFAEQHNRQFRLDGQVDCIISDSPLLLSSVYRDPPDTLLHAFVLQEFKKYENVNFYVKRLKPYNPLGRQGDKKHAELIDEKTINMLRNEQIEFTIVDGNWEGANKVLETVLQRLNIKQQYKICKI